MRLSSPPLTFLPIIILPLPTSRKSQGYRTRVSEEFRAGARVVMFSSDVSARGVDYPDVSLVVQVGLPTDRDQVRWPRRGKSRWDDGFAI